MSTHVHSPARSIDDIHEQARLLLAQQDQRYTTGRQDLIDTLHSAGRPLTLPGVLELAPDLTQSSAYRNLDVLESSGIITRINAPGDHTYYELDESLMGHHHHLICVACNLIVDVELPASLEAIVDEGLSESAARAGFTPLHHTLDLFGTCANCEAS